jgi:cytoskeletal protein CcmA (bactofilin family)
MSHKNNGTIMFFKKSDKTNIQSTIDTLIGDETKITGDLQFTGGLRIDGELIGNISESNINPSTLIISESGKIEGTITASKIIINGTVNGPVKATQFLELQSKAHITGDVHYTALEMHTGAVVEGRLIYLGSNETDGVVERLEHVS